MSDTHQGTVPDWSGGQKVMAGEMFLGLYQPSPETTGFWEGAARGELLLKWCTRCARFHHPRRMMCPECSAMGLTWKRASGRGKVYSFSEVHRAPTKEFAKGAPYMVGLIETTEGVHFFCRIVAENGTQITVDAPAYLEFRVLENGYRLPIFVVSGKMPA